MFAFLRGRRGDFFDQRKRQLEVCRKLRRIVDATAPHEEPSDSEARVYKRYNRSVPVLVATWNETAEAEWNVENAWLGVTKDFSDMGISVLLMESIDTSVVACGFWLETPVFALGKVAHTFPFGAGFWQTGIHLTELLADADVQPLMSLAEQLRPREVALA